MTKREQKERAKIKKELQKKGLLPPDKKRLNRKKYIEEAREVWKGKDPEWMIWNYYISKAIGIMLGHCERRTARPSLEAVGVAKMLKLACRLKEFHEELREKGQKEYKVSELYDYIWDVIEE